MTPESTILILGQRPDPHIDQVARHLADAGARAIVLDRSASNYCTLRPAASRRLSCIHDGNHRIGLDEVTAVWWRVKPSTPAEFAGGSARIEDAFRWAEWRHLLGSLTVSLSAARWLNPVDAHYAIASKPAQLALAADLGFAVPDTVVTNDADEVLSLFSRHRRVVYKTLSSFIIPPDEMIFTNEITPDQVRREAAAIALAPGIFQGYVEKDHEVRVTVVGETVYAVRIDSQCRKQTRIDWRHDQLVEMYSRGTFEGGDLRRLLAFHRRAGLVFGAYDFIVDRDGNLIFLECNPGGQWLWLENATALPISQTLGLWLMGQPNPA